MFARDCGLCDYLSAGETLRLCVCVCVCLRRWGADGGEKKKCDKTVVTSWFQGWVESSGGHKQMKGTTADCTCSLCVCVCVYVL